MEEYEHMHTKLREFSVQIDSELEWGDACEEKQSEPDSNTIYPDYKCRSEWDLEPREGATASIPFIHYRGKS